MNLGLFYSTRKAPAAILCISGVALLLSGCIAPVIAPSETLVEPTQPQLSITPAPPVTTAEKEVSAKKDITPDEGVSLTPALLKDILLASIASQRRQPKVALEALSRAVYASRDPRLNANAIELAMHLEDYPKAIALSRLMLSKDPDNFRVILALADALIKSDRAEESVTTLLDLVKSREPGEEPILQEVASLIARQKDENKDALTEKLADAASENHPMVVFTNALLASRLENEDSFRNYLDQVLELVPDWETAAILKLTDSADQNPELMREWAEIYLKQQPESERFRVQFARLLIQEEELEQALEELNRLLKIKPESVDGTFTAALVNMDLKNYDVAASQFARYIDANENTDQAKLYLAQIHIEQEKYSSASPLLRQIQSGRYYLDAQIALSGVIAKQSNVEAGLSYLRNIGVRGEDQRIRLILEQDTLLREFDQEQRSFELLGEALQARPEHPDLLYSRGLLAAKLDLINVVEQDLKKLIKIQPDNAHAYNALGYTLADQTDRYDEALELISKALEFLPDDAFILDSMGWVHYRKGNNKKALEYLERAVEIRNDAEIAAHLGEVLWILGKRKEAEDIWEQGKEWGPKNTTLINTINRFLGDEAQQRAVLLQGLSKYQAA